MERSSARSPGSRGSGARFSRAGLRREARGDGAWIRRMMYKAPRLDDEEGYTRKCFSMSSNFLSGSTTRRDYPFQEKEAMRKPTLEIQPADQCVEEPSRELRREQASRGMEEGIGPCETIRMSGSRRQRGYALGTVQDSRRGKELGFWSSPWFLPSLRCIPHDVTSHCSGCDSSPSPAFIPVRFMTSSTALLLSILVLLIPGILNGNAYRGLDGITFANAAPCFPNATGTVETVNISAISGINLTSYFDCEDGEFEVTWWGSISVYNTVRIGARTKVSIFGNHDNGLLTQDYADKLLGNSYSDDTTDLIMQMEDRSSEIVATGPPFGSIFFLESAVLYMENISLRGGNATKVTFSGVASGGGITAFGSDVTVIGCQFEDMFTDYWGAGIYANRSRLVVQNSLFRKCTSGATPEPDDEGVLGAGGGIGHWDGELLVENCVFHECYASKKGGAIQHTIGGFTVANSTFWKNSAGSDNEEDKEEIGEGGDISATTCVNEFEGTNGACLINDCTFHHSRVGKKAAVMMISTGDWYPNNFSHVEFNRCLVVNASCGKTTEDDPQGEGAGVVVAKQQLVTIRNSTFANNTVGKKGGVIVLSSGDDEDVLGGAAVLTNSVFEGNHAGGGPGGVAYLNSFTMLNISGNSNRFLYNTASEEGGVASSTDNTWINVEGGYFFGNEAGEHGGVFHSKKGEVNITGGEYTDNKADNGAVLALSEGSTFNVKGGDFHENKAEEFGGVAIVEGEAKLSIDGGTYWNNNADNGGVFAVEIDGSIAMIGGTYTGNSAGFGGFLHKEGSGDVSCSGALIQQNTGLDGGALYLVDAEVDWQCDLVANEALVAPAIYARDNSIIYVQHATISNNTVSRGSMAFLVSSKLYTYEVIFQHVGNSELSAVQADGHSTYIAERTVFRGFEEEAVVYSEGTLHLDDCDFSESPASVLVDGREGSTIVRNALLGDLNYNQAREDASNSPVPDISSIITASIKCEDTNNSSLCSEGSTCIEGDLGVYCQCYTGIFTEKEICVSPEAEIVQLTKVVAPGTEFYPNYIEADLKIESISIYDELSVTSSMGGITGSDGSVVWSASVESDLAIEWTLFPSTGRLISGQSIGVLLVGNPNRDVDGNGDININVRFMGSSSVSSHQETMGVTFFHCTAGNYWDPQISTCKICADVEGEAAGLDCSANGISLETLPLKKGYWRATLESTIIHECLNQEACESGSNVKFVNEYCKKGYEGPLCAVCSEGYGRGVANACHECTESFKGGMYFVITLAALLTIVVGTLIAIYLVGGTGAITSTIDTTRESVRTLRRRSSDLLAVSISSTIPMGSSTSGARTNASYVSSNDISGSGEDAYLSSSRFGGLRRFGSVDSTSGPRRKTAKVGRALSVGVIDFNDGNPRCGSETASELPVHISREASFHAIESRINDVWEIYNPSEKKENISTKSTKVEAKGPPSTSNFRDNIPNADTQIVRCPEDGRIGFTPLMSGGGVKALIFPKLSSRRDNPASFRRLQWHGSDRMVNCDSLGSMRRSKNGNKSSWISGGTDDTEGKDGKTNESNLDNIIGEHHVLSPSNGGRGGLASGCSGTMSGITERAATAGTASQTFPRRNEFGANNHARHVHGGATKLESVPKVDYRQGIEFGDFRTLSSEQKDGQIGDAGCTTITPEVFTSSSGKQGGSRAVAAVASTTPHQLLAPAATVGRQGSDRSKTNAGGRHEEQHEEDKSAATRIGDFLAKLPLSKLKIVIVVWQITSSFADITQVPFPPIYEQFLQTIGLFSFDLGWILSASCLTTGLNFYSKLLFVTIGPMVLFCLLAITFFIGSRQRHANTSGRIIPSSDASSSVRHSHPFQLRSDLEKDHTKSEGNGDAGSRSTPGESLNVETLTTRFVKDSGGERMTGTKESVQAPRSLGNLKEKPLQGRRSRRGLLRAGSGEGMDPEQSRTWKLFARHTTMSLIILYLVYTQVSTVVFQTFSCDDFDEINERFLRADLRIKCGTATHHFYEVYAGVMIFIYPFGIPAAFGYFLNRQRSRINPKVHKGSNDYFDVTERKMEIRKNDETVTPTSFLWAAYLPQCYYYEVVECARRLLLTGLLVFVTPNSSEQVAIGCILSFLSLMTFELLNPHADNLDLQLYRTGCLVIFCSNFLALMIKADVSRPESRSSTIFSIILVIVNVMFFLSIFWNTYASMKVMLSTRHIQESLFGVDIVPERQMNKIIRSQESKAKADKYISLFGSCWNWRQSPEDSLEAPPAWDSDNSVDLAMDTSLTTSAAAAAAPRVGSQHIRQPQVISDVDMAAPRHSRSFAPSGSGGTDSTPAERFPGTTRGWIQ